MLALFLIIYVICDIINLGKHPGVPTVYRQSEPSTKKDVKKYASNVFDDLTEEDIY